TTELEVTNPSSASTFTIVVITTELEVTNLSSASTFTIVVITTELEATQPIQFSGFNHRRDHDRAGSH
ncbi:hypothetical protein V0R52_27600, partial [Pseudomonas asiatica]|uniref:hypothetical protein n=1 Tax=Pseudomonas asiatica TaxID=2219225 RepID=UPI002E7B82B7